MSELKTLATCDPFEFLSQTSRIKKSVERWLNLTDVLSIRSRTPVLETASETATVEEKAEIFSRNKEKIRKQGLENFSKMYTAVAEEHPAETVEILALCCFVEPEDARNYSMREYLVAINSLLKDEAVLDFFTSLASLAQRNI